MYRESVNPALDKRIFSRTAVATKEMNIHPKIMRGGTRM